MSSGIPASLVRHERLAAVETRLLDVLRDAGFSRVFVPTFAPLDGYADRLGDEVRTEYVTFALDGEQVLRPEFTTSVCRLVLDAASLRDAESPLRLAYAGQTFRVHRDHTLFPHERRQIGGELVGRPAPEGDGEVLGVLAALVAALGGADWTLSLGHAGLLGHALIARGATPPQAERVRRDLHRLRRHAERLRTGDGLLADVLPRLLRARARRAGFEAPGGADADAVAIERQVVRAEWRRAGLPAAALALLDELTAARQAAAGDFVAATEAFEDAVGAAVRAPLDELRAAHARLAAASPPFAVAFDPTASRDLSYYTGILYELRPAGGGPPLGGGGRYDRLFTAIGGAAVGRSAIGFALDVGRIERALAAADGGEPAEGRHA